VEVTAGDRRLGVADDLARVAQALSEGAESVAHEDPSISRWSAETTLLRRLAEGVERAEGQPPAARSALAEFIDAYRDAGEVRARQRLLASRLEVETLTPGRRIYATVHEGGGTDHTAYLTTNGRWRAVRKGGGYTLWRNFGGSWQQAGSRWVAGAEPLLCLRWGSSRTNVDALEAALAQDRRDGLWPPPELEDRAAPSGAGRYGTPPATPERSSVRAVLSVDGEEAVYCVGHDELEHDRCTRLDPSLPLAVALLDLDPEADEVGWAAPAGQLSARVVEFLRSGG
jgi:hypothetical protein